MRILELERRSEWITGQGKDDRGIYTRLESYSALQITASECQSRASFGRLTRSAGNAGSGDGGGDERENREAHRARDRGRVGEKVCRKLAILRRSRMRTECSIRLDIYGLLASGGGQMSLRGPSMLGSGVDVEIIHPKACFIETQPESVRLNSSLCKERST